MDFAPLAVAATIILTGMALLKNLTNKEYKDAMTLVVAMGLGIAVAFLLRASDFASGIDLSDGKSLANINGASTVLVGVALSSLARTGYQAIKAVDGNQSAAESKLFPPDTP